MCDKSLGNGMGLFSCRFNYGAWFLEALPAGVQAGHA